MENGKWRKTNEKLRKNNGKQGKSEEKWRKTNEKRRKNNGKQGKSEEKWRKTNEKRRKSNGKQGKSEETVPTTKKKIPKQEKTQKNPHPIVIIPQQEIWSAMASFLRQAEAKVERKKDIDLFLSLQQADPEAALNPATAPGQMRKMCIVQVTGCPKSLKCLILIQTHTGNRWVSAIEFGQIHKVWETTHRMEDAGRSKFQLGTLLHGFQSLQALCCVVSGVSEIFWICHIISMIFRGFIQVYHSIVDQSWETVSFLLSGGLGRGLADLWAWGCDFLSLVTPNFGWFKCWKRPAFLSQLVNVWSILGQNWLKGKLTGNPYVKTCENPIKHIPQRLRSRNLVRMRRRQSVKPVKLKLEPQGLYKIVMLGREKKEAVRIRWN